MPGQQPSTGRPPETQDSILNQTEDLYYQKNLPQISSMKTLPPESSPIQNPGQPIKQANSPMNQIDISKMSLNQAIDMAYVERGRYSMIH